jgi:hypothetical protein
LIRSGRWGNADSGDDWPDSARAFSQGQDVKEIVRDLKVSRNTVRKVLRSGETAFEYERDIQPRPKLGRWTADLDALLAGNAAKSAREQLTLIRVFEELRERGYDGGYDAVRRYARRWSKERGQSSAAAYVPLSFAPGEAYQFDWSHEVVLLNGTMLGEAYYRSLAVITREMTDEDTVTSQDIATYQEPAANQVKTNLDIVVRCADEVYAAIFNFVGINFGIKFKDWSVTLVPKPRKAIEALERLQRPISDELWVKAWLELPSVAFAVIRAAAEEAQRPLPETVTREFPFMFRDLAIIHLPERADVVPLIERAKAIWREQVPDLASNRWDRNHVLKVLILAHRLLSEKPTRKGAARFIWAIEGCYGEVFRSLGVVVDRVKGESIFGGLKSKATFEQLWRRIGDTVNGTA